VLATVNILSVYLAINSNHTRTEKGSQEFMQSQQ